MELCIVKVIEVQYRVGGRTNAMGQCLIKFGAARKFTS